MANLLKIFYTHLLLFGLLISIVHSQSRDLKFEHLGIPDGLPSNGVTVIKQDSLGFIWFGTDAGLVRYDGYRMEVFQFDENDPGSISGNLIADIAEDTRSNLWIATELNGVNKYDRKSGKFIRFQHNPADSKSLSSNDIWSIFLDGDENLWIVYEHSGFDKLDIRSRTVTRVSQDNTISKRFNKVSTYRLAGQTKKRTAFCVDNKGYVWIGTPNAGVFRYHPNSDSFTQYKYDPNNPASIRSNWITFIFQDSRELIWFATLGGGLSCFSKETGKFSNFQHDDKNPDTIASDSCYYIFEDNAGFLWISHRINTLDRLDLENGVFTHFDPCPRTPRNWNIYFTPFWHDESDVLWIINNGWPREQILRYYCTSGQFDYYEENHNDPFGIRATYIRSYCKDFSGIVWFGTPFRGINKLNTFAQNFINLKHDPTNVNSLCNNQVFAVQQSKSHPENIWIGTLTGLDKYNLKTGSFTHYKYDPLETHGPPDNVMSLCEDEKGRLWIGSSGPGGLSCYDESTNQFINYTAIQREANKLYPWNIGSLFLENQNLLWIGTSNNGLYRYDIEKNIFTNYIPDPSFKGEIYRNSIVKIYQDRQGILWLGTDQGLYKFNRHDETFSHYLSNREIVTIYEDRKHNLWLGSDHNSGLGLFDRATGEAIFFNKSHGLPCNRIDAIFEDDHGHLWLATEGGGFSRFDPGSMTFTNFSEQNGLQTQLFHMSGTKLDDGRICQSTVYNGVVIFHPDEIKINTIPPKIVFTDFRIFNKSLTAHPDSTLKVDITAAKEIHLTHWQNDLAIECTALHYSRSEKNQYKFWLENYDRDWYYTGTNRMATYTNLDPGTYIFHAKAANSDGVWNEKDKSLGIIIDPPWWATWWAYGIYTIAVLSILIITWRLQLRRIHLRNDLKMRTFESEKLKEVDHLKSRFFANISHEFRTPITLILGPLEKILTTTTDDAIKGDLGVMRRNAKRLLRLINQMLDLSKFEAGKMKLQLRHENIVPLINQFVQSFESEAKLKEINLTFSAAPHMIWLYIDVEKLENIITNLISNALKFTPAGGRITVTMRKIEPTEKYVDGFVDIRVSDTGAGLQPDQLEKIFDRFYKVDESSTRGQEGSGIGLALTKELVELHQGEIFVDSQPGKGTTFKVRLPMGRGHLTDKDIVTEDFEKVKDTALEADGMKTTIDGDIVAKQSQNKKAPILLIVEDNLDLCDYMRDILSFDYRIKEAQDGETGLHLALKIIPDLIISDVMMPVMDGIELCKRLKTDERTSHIPVIILTARAGLESKLEGLETGADDYIIKPFDAKELDVRVKNLINSRRRLKQHFSRRVDLNLKEIAITSTDQQFLQRACDLIDAHIADPGFGVHQFSRNIGLSRAQLYRKLHGLVNQSASEFIRTIRLKRGAELLEKRAGNIAEIAFQVGFSSPSYFSKCFRQQFGVLPSDYFNPKSDGL